MRQQLKIVLLAVAFMALIAGFVNCAKSGPQNTQNPIENGQGSNNSPPTDICNTIDCKTKKYNLFIADLDGSNVRVLKSSSYQDMTHPRFSSDKKWITYTTYNDLNAQNCATSDQGYLNTEIRAVKLDGSDDRVLIPAVKNELHTNDYWITPNNEFTYLAGPVTSLKIYRASVDANMKLVGSPKHIPVPSTIVPMDPQANGVTGKIVFPGLYNSGTGFVKSIFIMNTSDSQEIVGLTLGRDHKGMVIQCSNSACENIMENDPKISPDGSHVAFMRFANVSGGDGFGWHIFVVPVTNKLTEKDISYQHLGSNILLNDTMPEWIDNNTLIFSTFNFLSANNSVREIFKMNADGSNRSKINLPAGFRYADVFPFTDSDGKQNIVVNAEKISASCQAP